MEEWKDVVGFEGIYEVSNKGKIRSSKNKTTYSKLHGVRKWKQRILRLKTDKNGYKRVCLYKNKKPHDFLVHRLVALAFMPAVEGKDYINHIDGNPSNNYVENLEWCNHRENLIHAFDNRLNRSPDPIVLYNLNNKTLHFFRSKSEASKFVGRNNGYISSILSKGINEVDEFLIFTHKG